MRRASETNVFSKAEMDSMRASMSDAQWAQEMECDFGASSENTLLLLEDVLAAQRRGITEGDYGHAPKVLGVDVARYGNDKSVIFPRQGLAAFKPRVVQGMSTMDLAGLVAEAIERFEPDATFVDAGGVGGGVIDRLLQLRFQVMGIDFGGKPSDNRFENRRAEMWWRMADWVKDGAVLPEGERLIAELTAPQYTYKNARGRLQLESKDDMRKRGLPSPDIADALALTFAAPVAPRPLWQRVPGIRPEPGCVTEFDPFERRA
jgi:hypothetical protein